MGRLFKTTLILLTIFGFFEKIESQEAASVTWALTEDQNVTTTIGLVTGTNQSFSYSATDPTLNLQVRDYNNSATGGGQRLNLGTTNWPNESGENPGRYIEFSVKPQNGYNLNVTSIALDLGGGGTSHMKANQYFSTDSTFVTRTKLNTTPDLPNSAWLDPAPSYQLDINIGDEETFYFRLYVWYQENPSQTKYIWIRNVVISGITSLEGVVLPPNVSTSNITNITPTSALSGGNIISDGGAAVTERGICWNTVGSPTISDSKTMDGSGLGAYESLISGLTLGVVYYVRAYATNSAGTSYGNELSFIARTQVVAFPGAEGEGRHSVGGRGGSVYEVTNLNNSGPGSIVDAVSQGNRTIVFRVSGTVELGSVILQPKSYTTIAGQTAPGDGICIKGRIKIGNVTDIVIRFIRVRVDEGAANSSGDAIDIEAGTNIIIDHVSASYARDEGISCQEKSNKVTVQWCLISEALTFEGHSYGSLVRGDLGDKKTYHHNLYAHNNNRNPRPGNYTSIENDSLGLFFDFRNNVIYNWKGSEPGYNDDISSVSRYNFIGNAYIPGPESHTIGSKIFREKAGNSYGYFENNSYNGIVPSDPWSLVTFNLLQDEVNVYKARSYLIPMEPVTTSSPEQAKTDVLAHAGASFPKRDIIDTRIVNDVRNGTGQSIMFTNAQPEGGWPALNSSVAPLDSDKDGMPDAWEFTNGLNMNNPSDGSNYTASGYTNLEIYLNELVHNTITSIDDYKEIPSGFVIEQNYPNPFNPSTTITYFVPQNGNVIINIHNIQGKLIRKLYDGEQNIGRHQIIWDGKNNNGNPVATGIYIGTLNFGEQIKTVKMLLLK